MDREEIIQNLRQFISQESPIDTNGIDVTSDLFELKIMDSFRILNLVLYLEDFIGSQLDPSELVEENFRNLNSITELVLKYTK